MAGGAPEGVAVQDLGVEDLLHHGAGDLGRVLVTADERGLGRRVELPHPVRDVERRVALHRVRHGQEVPVGGLLDPAELVARERDGRREAVVEIGHAPSMPAAPRTGTPERPGRAQRELSASLALRATKAAAKVRRIHVMTAGRDTTWCRTAAANVP